MPGKPSTPGASDVPVGKGRPTRVRNRLIAAVAVVTAAVAGAGAPSVIAASGQLRDSQNLVTLAEQTQNALTLAHSLADERDEVTSYLAAGRPKTKAPSQQRSTRVDRQVDELRADPGTPAWLRKDLDGIAAVRRAALTGQSSALQAHQAYSTTIAELHKLAEQLAERMPARAGSGAYALAELDTAVQQAAAARGLLLAALNVPNSTRTVIDPVTGLPTQVSTASGADSKQRDALSAAAQQARLRSDAALASFRDIAPQAARTSYDSTVTGPEVEAAEKYLASLTDQPTLSDGELNTSVKKAEAALSARVDLMRGVESSLYDGRTKALEGLRDDDVTSLEIRIALLGALLLVTIGITTAIARTLTRPLAVVRLGSARLAGAADPAAAEPVRFTGRNDEFAQVVRSVNALHAKAVALAERVATLEADRKHLVGQRQKMADAREELQAALNESTDRLERLRAGIGGTFVNLALRTLGLVERQLTVIERLENSEQDPDRLSTLFKLDHFATVMRRHSENLLVLAGSEHVQHTAGPVPLVDVVRAAVSEIEHYERVRIAALPPHSQVTGFAADDLSHLLAELMENATSFSPSEQPVEVSGWLMESGEVMLSVQDEGSGMSAGRLERLNARLADFDPESPYEQEGEDGLGLGLYVVARLAHRHGVSVRLRARKQGGTAAVVVVPKSLLVPASDSPDTPSADTPSDDTSSADTSAVSRPDADAEADSHALPAQPEKQAPEPRAETTMEFLLPSSKEEPTPEQATSEKSEEPASEQPASDRPAPKEPAPEPAPADGEQPPQGPSTPGREARTDDAGENAPAEDEGEAGTTAGTKAGTEADTEAEVEAEHQRTPDAAQEAAQEPVTAKGLPKRTPRITAPATPRQRSTSVDAEELRRRLGSFHRGAKAGYREVEAENADRTTGGTVEEASS